MKKGDFHFCKSVLDQHFAKLAEEEAKLKAKLIKEEPPQAFTLFEICFEPLKEGEESVLIGNVSEASLELRIKIEDNLDVPVETKPSKA